MTKKLILFDVDGTLYDNANKCVPASTIAAIKKLKELGHELVVATGRAYFMLYSIEEIIHLFDHFILINGQHIMSLNKTIYEDVVDKDTLNKLIKNLKNKNITYGFQSSHNEAVSEVNSSVTASFKKLNLNIPPEDEEFYHREKVFQMWCFCDEDQIKVLEKEHPEFDFVKWMTVGYDIIKKGQSKGKGIKILQEHLGYKTEDIIAFGDGDNDVQMLKEVGLGIAMGNATEKLKQTSDYITTNIDNDGIKNALLHFNIIK